MILGTELTGTDIREIRGVGERRAALLASLGIRTAADMLEFFPRDYEDRSRILTVEQCREGDTVCVRAFAEGTPREQRIRRNFSLFHCTVSDRTGMLPVVIFNQKYLAAKLRRGEEYLLYGKIVRSRQELQLSLTEAEPVGECRLCGRILPKYALVAGLTGKVCMNLVSDCLTLANGAVRDPFSADFRREYRLCEINFALRQIHFPEDLHSLELARRRLAFEELFLLGTGLRMLRGNRRQVTCEPFAVTDLAPFLQTLPFSLTGAQRRVTEELMADLKTDRVMNRLVQGDVGSGKTAVAACAVYAAAKSGFQSVLMAPTEILARQHYESFCRFFEPFEEVECVLLTGKMKKSERTAALEKIKAGAALTVGTHAVLSDTLEFRRLGLVITDEQHRFGVRQRAALAHGSDVNMLVMTATPIPRTLALTLYGDLDLSVIDELPPGRQKILTYAVDDGMHARIYRFLRKQLDEGRQAYLICPLVDPSDQMEAKAVTEAAQELMCHELAGYRVGLMYGKMKEKDAVMEQFADGRLQVLVSTTVVEVGVNVPNATVMVIENAERFGLSQLHQLRGRVGRGSEQSYCILICQSDSAVAAERMKIMTQTDDGFVLAQKDMELRGIGEFFGTRQHGLPALKIANLFTDGELIALAAQAADRILAEDPSLTEHPDLKEQIEAFFSAGADGVVLN